MRKALPWLAGIAVGMCIIGLIMAGRAERRDYWMARGATVQHAQVTPHPTDLLLRRSPGQ